MNIVLSTDENYVVPTATCIQSIIEQNPDEDICFYILTNWISDDSIMKFAEMQERSGKEFVIKEVDGKEFVGLYTSDRYPLPVYYRMLAPSIIPDEKCLYLDGDIIVTGNIRCLYDTDIKGFACGVVEDSAGDDIRRHNKLNMYGLYFNSGVLLMNLDYWRENHITKQAVKMMSDNRKLFNRLPDQDCLNILLEGKVKKMSYIYNYQNAFYEGLTPAQRLLKNSKYELIERLMPSALVIHFTDTRKPWHMECLNPMANTARSIATRTPWKGFNITSKK